MGRTSAGLRSAPISAAAPSTEILASLVAPVAPADFLATHWNRRAIHTAGATWRSHVRFSLDQLKRGLPSFSLVKAQHVREGRHEELAIDGAQAAALFEAGFTICSSSIERHLPDLAEFTTRLRDDLRFAGEIGVNCYWSPAGGGFATHFDDHHVFILQVEGSKRWWFSPRPGCESPPANLVHAPEQVASWRARHPGLAVAPPDEAALVERVLRPGDSLYLPPGTWHRTAAGDFSLALTLALKSARLEAMVSSVARRWLERSVRWREGLPVDAASATGITSEGRAFLETRIEEFRGFAASLTPEMLAEEWLAATVGPALEGTPAPASRIEDGDLLLRERRLELCAGKGSGGAEVVVLLWTGGRCEMPEECAAFCRRLAATKRFTPEEARNWTDDGTVVDADEMRSVLEQLLRSGLLRRA
jgi:cupin superfamily protein